MQRDQISHTNRKVPVLQSETKIERMRIAIKEMQKLDPNLYRKIISKYQKQINNLKKQNNKK